MRKKNPAEFDNRVLGLDGHVLAQRYEALRRDVVQPGAGGQDARGLALLVRKGMAAWMRCVGEPGAGTGSTAASHDCTSAGSCAEVRKPGIEKMLVDIVAAMTLAQAKEAFA